MTRNDKNIDSGIEIATKPALRTPRKNINTARTRISPEMMLFSRLLTIIWMSSA